MNYQNTWQYKQNTYYLFWIIKNTVQIDAVSVLKILSQRWILSKSFFSKIATSCSSKPHSGQVKIFIFFGKSKFKSFNSFEFWFFVWRKIFFELMSFSKSKFSKKYSFGMIFLPDCSTASIIIFSILFILFSFKNIFWLLELLKK